MEAFNNGENIEMKPNVPKPISQKIMTEFADLTGLLSAENVPRRYLWTDAFAVCNFLELYRQTRDKKYQDLALRLVDQVHNILGRHRDDDPRTGWISGLDEQEGSLHPTKGGLRIGKEMNERGPQDPLEERLEWSRDGQYFHYVTKWMHALNRVSRETGDYKYNRWAKELAKTAHAKFTYVLQSGDQKCMYWKMSIDLSYPLIKPLGAQDPLDGFITYNQLQVTTTKDSEESARLDLNTEIADMAEICEGKNWASEDALGIGGLLCDAYKVAQLVVGETFEQAHLIAVLLDSSLSGLESYTKIDPFKFPADYRLAFRELGLSVGLHAVEALQGLIEGNPDRFNNKNALLLRIENLKQYVSLSETIEGFWLEPANTETDSWGANRDINMVMLATSLLPYGYLGL
jgi:hypothetical protein